MIGKSTTIDELMEEEGFDAVFIGSGAGLPKFMGIPGEQANGVFSANEYLTRSNLMKAFQPGCNTPIMPGKRGCCPIAVIRAKVSSTLVLLNLPQRDKFLARLLFLLKKG